MYSYESVFSDKQRIMFFGAHPDDIDVFFGGLIAKLVNDKKDVHCVVVTSGARGSRENVISLEELTAMRQKEEINAMGKLGLKEENISFLDFMDGEVCNDADTIEKIVYEIRAFQPDIVGAHNPNAYTFQYRDTQQFYVNHRDHRHVGMNVIDAVYPLSRDLSFYPQHIDAGLKRAQVMHLYLTGEGEYNTEIDTTDVLEMKRNAMKEHKSQFTDEVIESILLDDRIDTGFREKGLYLPLAF